MTNYDVAIIGAGHNGLVAANLLVDAGLSVIILERAGVVGGATRTEYPFSKAPNLAQSTGAYLLGLMPPELMQKLDIDIPLIRRDPHYFLPTRDERYLLFGSDRAETERQFKTFFSDADWEAECALHRELEAFREDVGHTWLCAPLSIEETAERFVRSELKQVFVDLCRGTISDYLDRFGFESDLIKAMYAVTDAFSGSTAGFDTPGGGMNFLVHNMCRLPHSDGTWMVVKGGMGTITQRLAARAAKKGAVIRTDAEVSSIEVEDGSFKRIVVNDQTIDAKAVLCNADPFRVASLLGDHLPQTYRDQLDNWSRPGTTMKVNMALDGLPKFTCLPEDRGQHRGTIHIFPNEENVLQSIRDAHQSALDGIPPQFPTMEWYIQTTVDPDLTDENGNLSAALFVQWVPETVEGGWESQIDDYARHLISLCDEFAPETSSRVVDIYPLTPESIESQFGISRGHIHHIDNIFGFDDRHPYRYPIDGVYSCSAGCHPAGSVIGAAGHNAAEALIDDLR